MKKSHLLITLAFDENMDNIDIIDTTMEIENEIVQLLNDLTHQQKIKHFVVGDDEVINEKIIEGM